MPKVRIPFRQLIQALGVEEATALAEQGAHIFRQKGRVVGAPEGVRLSALRRKLDAGAEMGARGQSWYSDARDATREMAGGDPKMERVLAAGQSIYSPRTPPADALGYTLAQVNRSAAEGPEAASNYTYRFGRQAKEFAPIIKEGDVGNNLGPKRQPYYQGVNPQSEGKNPFGVHDSWMAREYGYTQDAIGPAQHDFMTGESLLANKRAREAGVITHPDPGVEPWQAASWTGARERVLRKKGRLPGGVANAKPEGGVKEALDRFTANETWEVIPPRSNEHLAGAVDLPREKREALTTLLAGDPQRTDPYYEALGMAQRPQQAGLGQFSEPLKPDAAEPNTRRPMRNRAGDSIPYLGSPERAPYEESYRRNVEGMRAHPGVAFSEAELPLERVNPSHEVTSNPERTALYERGYREGAPPQRVLSYEDPPGSGRFSILDGNRRREAALRAGRKGIPAIVEHPAGEDFKAPPATDYNPNRTSRPMVSYAKGSTENPRLADPESQLLQGVNTLRSAVDAQAAGAYHVVKPTAKPSAQNAARVRFPRGLDSQEMYGAAEQVGLNLIDTGDGTFTVTGDFGSMPAARFKKAFEGLMSFIQARGGEVQLGKYIGQYNEMPAYGGGKVTEKLLTDIPEGSRMEGLLDTPRLRREYLVRNEAEKQAAKTYGLGPPRKDVQKLRALLAKGGVKAVREHVKKYGGAELPALLAAAGVGDDE